MNQQVEQGAIVKDNVEAQIVAARERISTILNTIIYDCYDNKSTMDVLKTQLRSLDHVFGVISQLLELSTPIKPLFVEENIVTENHETKLEFQLAIIDIILPDFNPWLNQLDYQIIACFEKQGIADESNIWDCFTSDYQMMESICKSLADEEINSRSLEIENYRIKIVDYQSMDTEKLFATIIKIFYGIEKFFNYGKENNKYNHMKKKRVPDRLKQIWENKWQKIYFLQKLKNHKDWFEDKWSSNKGGKRSYRARVPNEAQFVETDKQFIIMMINELISYNKTKVVKVVSKLTVDDVKIKFSSSNKEFTDQFQLDRSISSLFEFFEWLIDETEKALPVDIADDGVELVRHYYLRAMMLGDQAAKTCLLSLGEPSFDKETPLVENLARVNLYRVAGFGRDEIPHPALLIAINCGHELPKSDSVTNIGIDLSASISDKIYLMHYQDITKGNGMELFNQLIQTLVSSNNNFGEHLDETTLKAYTQVHSTQEKLDSFLSVAIRQMSPTATMLLLHCGAKSINADDLKFVSSGNKPYACQIIDLLVQYQCQYIAYKPKPSENKEDAHYISVFSILSVHPKHFKYFLKQIKNESRRFPDKCTRWTDANQRIIKQARVAAEKHNTHAFENLITYLDYCQTIQIEHTDKDIMNCLLGSSFAWITYIKEQLDKPTILKDKRWKSAVNGGTALGDLLRHLYYLATTKTKVPEGQCPVDYNELKASLEKIGMTGIDMLSNPALRKMFVFEQAKLFQDPNKDSINTLRKQLTHCENPVLRYLLKHHPDELLTTSKPKAESLLVFMYYMCSYLGEDPSLHTAIAKLKQCLGRKEHRFIFMPNTAGSLFFVYNNLLSEKKKYSNTEDDIYRVLICESFAKLNSHSPRCKYAPYAKLIRHYVLKESTRIEVYLANIADRLDKTYQTIVKLTSEPYHEDKLLNNNNLIFSDNVDYRTLLQQQGMSVRTLLLRLYVFDKNIYGYKGHYKNKSTVFDKKLYCYKLHDKNKSTDHKASYLNEKLKLEKLIKNLVADRNEQGKPLNTKIIGDYRSLAHAMFAEILKMIEDEVNPKMIEDLLYLICAGERWVDTHNKIYAERPLLSSVFRLFDGNLKNKSLVSRWDKTYHKGDTLKLIIPANISGDIGEIIQSIGGYFTKIRSAINNDPAITLAASLYELTQRCCEKEKPWVKKPGTYTKNTTNDSKTQAKKRESTAQIYKEESPGFIEMAGAAVFGFLGIQQKKPTRKDPSDVNNKPGGIFSL